MRKGFARIGYVALGLYVAMVAAAVWFEAPPDPHFARNPYWFVWTAVVPLGVWLAWRTLLWIFGGFTRRDSA